ncbi:MAG TPA: putative baseplate assembly protein [Blastocatellia bacterium]|nr:putative baseplate assembly protein [Blastocatellia bacterium]
MPIEAPNLDDRDFQQLIAESVGVIKKYTPQWTDLSPSDPGMILLETFAHLTEVLLYRLNRLPEKAYVEFLRLIGVKLYPPSAASVTLRFSLSRPQETAVEIPRGARVTIGRASGPNEAPVFIVARAARIEPGAQSVETTAYHCELIEGELVGIGDGMPGQTFNVARPPIIAPTGDDLDLIVGVEAREQELNERVPALKFGDKTFRIWREVENISEIGQDRFVYMTDRVNGAITFIPALSLPDGAGLSAHPERLAEVATSGREIRVWYRRGGGPHGNLAPNTLTVLKDPIPGVEVTNPAAATGGRPAETMENALFRGPQELHSLKRAVTAKDFERIAERVSGAVARARVFTKAALWKHAPPGTVEALLVPYYLEENQRSNGAVSAEKLKEQETEEARVRVQAELDERRPLGTTCLVNWVRYKTVRVKARVVVHRGEDPAAVKARVLDRLHQMINPLPTPLRRGGWNFGQPLRQFDVYDTVRQEPGVRYVDDVVFMIDEAPVRGVMALAADAFQPDTWYAGAESSLYRTLNDGAGWELSGRFEGEDVDIIRVHPGKAGLLGVVTILSGDASGSRLHISQDCGETWRQVAEMEFRIQDFAWAMRGVEPILWLATDTGLYELSTQPNASPVQVLVDPENQSSGYYAVTATTTMRGSSLVAVAAQSSGGIFVSDDGGKSGTFVNIGLKGEDVRVLEAQRDGVRTFLWAAVAVGGNDPERGCFRIEPEGSSEGWRNFVTGWDGGSCRALAFQGSKVIAATHHAGAVWLDSSKEDPAWQAPGLRCGLPFREAKMGRIFHPIEALAARTEDPQKNQKSLILAGGIDGVFRSDDGGAEAQYEGCSSKEFTKNVTIPDNWLFCSGEHDIEVVSEDEAE